MSKYVSELKESVLREWPWKRKPKPVKPRDPDAHLWEIYDELYTLECNALGQFGNKISDYVMKAEKVRPDRGVGYRFLELDMYKKYKPVFEKYYREALTNLIRALPFIKDKWKEAIEEWKTLSPKDKNYHQDRIKRYVKNMRVNDRKLAIDMINWKALLQGNPDHVAPDHVFEDSQTYSYCFLDYS